MDFVLEKDLCFFDVESTGLNVIRDRIVQLAIVKIHANDGREEELMELINPGIPISAESMSVHGITPAMVANKPTFPQLAEKIIKFIGEADLVGYNSNRFDVPILLEEFSRTGLELDMRNRKTIDVQRIFYKMEPRTLAAAHLFFTGKRMENAHDALADVKATINVMKGQLEKYKGVDLYDDNGLVASNPVRNDMQQLHDFTNDSSMIDATQRLKYNLDGVIVFNFGKYVGQPAAEVLVKDKHYYNWILNKEFSTQVKNLVRKLVHDYETANKK